MTSSGNLDYIQVKPAIISKIKVIFCEEKKV